MAPGTLRLPRSLVLATALLALLVVGLGAYVRLSDAGLGCPDWPGCYGQPTPHHAAEAIAAAHARAPEGPVSPAKAWKEMSHRYLASALGLAILAIAWLAWRRERGLNRALGLVLAGLVVFQGLLGMWTVTLLLRPAVVSAHLLGGMATLALLAWLAARLGRGGEASPAAPPRLAAGLALVAVAVQIALGGWVSANHAALACPDFPTCQGGWWPDADWPAAFHLTRDGGLGMAALAAVHWAHRLGALAATLGVGWLAWRLWTLPAWRPWSAGLLGLLAAQLTLGAANVLAGLPLAGAVAHTLGAALLLAALAWLNARLRSTA